MVKRGDENHSNRRLVRSRTTFEFIVKYPWGTTAISGYQKAARHFGWHTRHDPTFEGGDSYRLFVARSQKKLHDTVRLIVSYAEEENSAEEGDFLAGEMDILLHSDVSWFGHDYKWWDAEGDVGALDHMGLFRTIVERPDGSFRLTLRRTPRQKS